MNKTVGLIAGLVGGVFGLAASFIVLFVLEIENTNAWLGIIFSVLAIIGAIVSRKKRKIGGSLLLVAGIGVYFTVPLFHILVAILIIVAGFVGISQEDTPANGN